MQIDYELTEKDFVEAYRTHQDRTKFSKWARRVFIWMAFGITAIILVGFLLKPSIQAAESLVPFAGVVLLWIAFLWAFPRWNMSRQFHKQPGAHGPLTLLIDDAGAHWRWNGGSSDIAWENYIRWIDGRGQILFYSSPACFNILPKRGLTTEQVKQLQDLLKQNILSNS